MGQLNMLELARHREVEPFRLCLLLVGLWRQRDACRSGSRTGSTIPISLYAATKKADELMSETYAHLYRLPMTGLRFFTVYGPWGRPDMAMWIFTKAIFDGRADPGLQRRRDAPRLHLHRRHRRAASSPASTARPPTTAR